MKIWHHQADNFLELLKKDPLVSSKLSNEKLEQLFDFNYHTKHVESIFNAVFK